MIGDGDFYQLKSGVRGSGTAKQAEAGLAEFPQILCNSPKKNQRGCGKYRPRLYRGGIAKICLIRRDFEKFCYLVHSFGAEILAVLRKGMLGQVYLGVKWPILYLE